MSDLANDQRTPDAAHDPDHSTHFRHDGGRPELATAICIFLLVASCAGRIADPSTVRDVSGGGATGYGAAVGYLFGGAVAGLLLWGAAYAITIRRASRRWKIGSGIAVVSVGVLASLAPLSVGSAARRADTQAIKAQLANVLDAAAAGNQVEPIKPATDAGPLARMSAAIVNGEIAELNAHNAAAEAAGQSTVVTFQGLSKSSSVLDHCDQVAALTDRASASRARFPAIVAAARREGDAAIARGTASRADVDGFIRGVMKGQPRFDRQWELITSVSEDSGSLCRILARRRWTKDAKGTVLFTNDTDLAEAQPLLARLAASGRELTRMQDASRASGQSALKDLDTL